MSEDIDRTIEGYYETMPFLEKIGIEDATVDDGSAEVRVPYDESNTNNAVVHGGVMATLVDASVAGAIPAPRKRRLRR